MLRDERAVVVTNLNVLIILLLEAQPNFKTTWKHFDYL